MPEPIKADLSWWRAITMTVGAVVAVAVVSPAILFHDNFWLLAVLIALLVVLVLAAARRIPDAVLVLAYVAFLTIWISSTYYDNPQSLGGNLWRVAAFVGVPVATAGIVALSQWVVQRLFPDRDPPVEALLSRSAEQREAEPIVLLERRANCALVLFVGATFTPLLGAVTWGMLRPGGNIIGYLMAAFTVMWFVGFVFNPLFVRRRISFDARTMTYTVQGPVRSRSQAVALADVKNVKFSKYYTEVRTHGNQRIRIPEVAFAPKDIGIALYFLLGTRDYLSRTIVNPVAMTLFLGTAVLWAAAIGFLIYSILYLDGWHRIAVIWAGE